MTTEVNELNRALKLFLETKELSELNLDTVPSSVRPGRESQKREAASALETIKKDYGVALQKAAFGLAVQGPGAAEFVKLCQEETDLLTVDAGVLYKRIADRVGPTMGDGRRFGVSQFSLVIQELRAIGQELNIDSMPSPSWSEPVDVSGEEGLLNHVRNMVDSSVGVDLLALYVKSQMTDAGLAERLVSDRKTVLVLITGLNEATAAALLTKAFVEGRSSLVNTSKEVTKEVTKEAVLEHLNKIKKQINQNNKLKKS